MIKCQCDKASVDHGAGGCRFYAKVYVKRGDKTLAVCGDCRLTKDVELRDVEPDE